MMIDDDFYNKLCSLFFQEEVRLKNNVIDAQNYILKYNPVEPEAYIKLAQAQAVFDHYNRYIGPFLRWIENYTGNG